MRIITRDRFKVSAKFSTVARSLGHDVISHTFFGQYFGGQHCRKSLSVSKVLADANVTKICVENCVGQKQLGANVLFRCDFF